MKTAQMEVSWPELPEGYFFRVRTSVLGIYPWVQLRKKSRLFGSYLKDEVWQSHTKFSSVIEEVEYLAGVLSDRVIERSRVFGGEYFEGDFK